MNLSLQAILYATFMGAMFMNAVKARGDSRCHDIAVEFIPEPGFVYINNSIIGIPDEAEVEIECDCLSPSKKTPSPDWSYNDIDINSTRREDDLSSPYVQNSGSNARLKIESFRERSSGLYTCHSRDRTVNFSLTWYDPDNEPQLVVEPENLNIHITEGNETAVLHCNAFGADTYTWERKDGMIPDKAVLREAGTILEIPNIRRGEAGSYRCIVENSAGRSTSQYSDVIVTEELRITEDPVDASPRIGTSVTLTCGSEGFQSENFTYLWTKNSSNLVYTEASSSGTSNLVFLVVRPSDSGEYTCTVRNEWGAQVTSKPAYLTPVPFPSLNQSRGTVDGFSVTLNWELSDIYGDLLDSVIIVTEWISLLEYGGRSKRQVTGNTDTVNITDLTITQYTFTELQPFSHYCFTVSAQYAFEGQALGEVAAEPFCTNTSEAAPSAPRDVTVLSQGFTSLTLTWTTPQSPNGIILHYTIRYNDEVKVIAVEDVYPSVILSELPTDTVYSIRVTATNSAGEGNYSNIITTKTLDQMTTGGATKGQLLFQIRVVLDDSQSCQEWMSNSHRQLIVSGVSSLIQRECNCILEEVTIDNDILLCDQSQSNTTVFRAEIVTYQITSDDLLTILQNLVNGGRLMLNDSTIVRLDNSCPVEISSFNDPLCSTVPVSAESKDEETKSPKGAIIASIIAVIVIIILLLALLVLLLLYRRKRRSGIYSTTNDKLKEEKRSEEEAEVEGAPTVVYSAPLSMTEESTQNGCPVGKDGYLIPVQSKIESSINISINDVEFDDDVYLKSVQKQIKCIHEHSDVKMQPNPSYRGATIPCDDSS